ncbi:MAG: dihydrolipoamide acetyltransferase [Patescibacteria group bacterium]|nr:MAG: dihydrolipoamide acetyltransferase [Patescibacteria group bacterium]
MSEKIEFGFLIGALDAFGTTKPEEDFQVAEIEDICVKPGERVKKGDVLFTVRTDKVVDDITAPADGVIGEVFFKEGEEWHVSKVQDSLYGKMLMPALYSMEIVSVCSEEDGTNTTPPAPASENTGKGPTTVPPLSDPPKKGSCSVKPRISRVAMDIIVEHKVNLCQLVAFTEGKMSIDEEDVKSFLKSNFSSSRQEIAVPRARTFARKKEIALKDVRGSGPGGVILASDVAGTSVSDRKQKESSEGRKKESVRDDRADVGASQMRKAIARLLAKSHREIVQAGGSISIDVSVLKTFRDKYKDMWLATHGVKLRYDHLFAYILLRCLMDPEHSEHKVLNGYWDQEREEGVVFHDVNLGMAAASPLGLVVPVVRGANKLSFTEFVAQAEEKFNRAQKNRLTARDLADLTFTFNNAGILGIEVPGPIIPYVRESDGSERPSAMILSVGKMMQDKQTEKYKVNVAYRFDHRLIDGGSPVGLVVAIKRYIESKTIADDFIEIMRPDFLKQ